MFTDDLSDTKDDIDLNSSQILFQTFEIEFLEPIKRKVNCIKLIKIDRDHSFKVYRAIDLLTHDMLNVYEWIISLEKNKIFRNDNQKNLG